jgi:hypothetical protein
MDDYSEKKFEMHKKVLLIFIALLAFLIFAYLSGEVSWMKDILQFIQLISSIFALFIGVLALLRFYTKKSKLSFLVLGIGFLFVGFLDIFQLLVSLNGFKDFLSYSEAEIFPLSMVLSRFFLAVIFFLSYIVRKDYENPDEKKEKRISIVIVGIFLVLITIFLLFTNVLSMYQDYLPAIVGGILSLVMLAFSVFGYWKANVWKYEAFEYWTMFAIIFLLISSIFFLPFLNLEYRLLSIFSVLAQFLSYVLMLVGFLVSIYEMYSRETEYLEELKEKNESILKAKNSIEDAYLLLRNEKWEIARGKGKGKMEGILKDVIEGKNED